MIVSLISSRRWLYYVFMDRFVAYFYNLTVQKTLEIRLSAVGLDAEVSFTEMCIP